MDFWQLSRRSWDLNSGLPAPKPKLFLHITLPPNHPRGLPTGNPRAYSPQHSWPQKSLSANPEPHTDQATCPDHQAWMVEREHRGRGERRGTQFCLERHLLFPVTSRPKGLWCELPKIPKLNNTSPAPYLTKEKTVAQRAQAELFCFIQKSPIRARVGTQASWLQCQVHPLPPLQHTGPLHKMLCGVLKLRTLSSHSFQRGDSRQGSHTWERKPLTTPPS